MLGTELAFIHTYAFIWNIINLSWNDGFLLLLLSPVMKYLTFKPVKVVRLIKFAAELYYAGFRLFWNWGKLLQCFWFQTFKRYTRNEFDLLKKFVVFLESMRFSCDGEGYDVFC